MKQTQKEQFKCNVRPTITLSGGLREITLDLAKKVAGIVKKNIPGNKLCPNCKRVIKCTSHESTAESHDTEE